jgi:cold shock protein
MWEQLEVSLRLPQRSDNLTVRVGWLKYPLIETYRSCAGLLGGKRMATQLDRIERMLAALCDHLGVHDLSQKSIPETSNALGADNGHRYLGTVSRFEHGWGFIECKELGRNFFVHYSDVEGTGLRVLEAGEGVSFEIGPGKDGRPKAVRVRHEGTSHTSSGGPQMPALSTEETPREDESHVEAPSGEDGDDTPQPELSIASSHRMPARKVSAKYSRLGTARKRRPAISW